VRLLGLFATCTSYVYSRGRYDDAIKQLVYGVQSEVDAYQPTALIRLTRALMPEYRLGTQQDAHEYMHLLLSAWAEDYGLNAKDFMQSPAYSSFGGCYSQVCHCLTCGEESRKFVAELDLSVEIMHYVEETVADPLLLPTTLLIPFLQQSWNVFHDLEECLRSYFKRSKMTGDNQVSFDFHFNPRFGFFPDAILQVVLPQMQRKSRQRVWSGRVLTPAILMRQSQAFLERC